MAQNQTLQTPAQQVPVAGTRFEARALTKLLFMETVLDLLSRGSFFKKVFAVVLRVVAAIAALLGLVSWISIWGVILKLNVGAILGGLIFQLGYLASVYIFVHTLLIRARQISALPESGYAIIPITSIFLKLAGELFASATIPIGIAGGIFIWFAGFEAFQLLPRFAALGLGPSAGTSFLIGILFMIVNIALAFAVLVFFYFLSEAISVQVDIAHNTRETSQLLQTGATSTEQQERPAA